MILPAILNSLSRPKEPAAAAAVTRPVNISWIIGDACPSTPMPAVTFMQSTPQSSPNCGVLKTTLKVQHTHGDESLEHAVGGRGLVMIHQTPSACTVL